MNKPLRGDKMQLKRFQITNFKNIEDSGIVDINDTTCLVGKNESGKTAILEALCRFNPVDPRNQDFDLEAEFPRGIGRKEKKEKKHPESIVLRVWFELSQEELGSINQSFCDGFMVERIFSVTMNYENKKEYCFDYEEGVYVKHLISNRLTASLGEGVSGVNTIEELERCLEQHTGKPEVDSLLSEFGESSVTETILKCLIFPQFFYFDEYSTLPGQISLQGLNSSGSLKVCDDGALTARALLELANMSTDNLNRQSDHDTNIAALESASNDISDELFRFWSQNKDLEVKFEIRPANNPNDQLLLLRIFNRKHRASVPFERRSKGFVWFFSFLVAFSKYKNSTEDIILLLDEPGLNLHAKAQSDLLNYFKCELEPHHQIIYSTHSPFMIDPKRLESVRTVEDNESGAKVSNNPLYCNSDTLFPLQAALGYELAQTLFVGPNVVLVEGPSDLLYLRIAAEIENCDIFDKWTITPVGGADKLSTFISLMGPNNLEIAVVIDVSSKDQQKIEKLKKRNFIRSKNIITFGDILGKKNADIEDMLDPVGYIDLVKACYAKELEGNADWLSDSPSGDTRIVKRVENSFKSKMINKGNFSHFKPALLLNEKPNLKPKVFNESALQNFRRLFEKISNIV